LWLGWRIRGINGGSSPEQTELGCCLLLQALGFEEEEENALYMPKEYIFRDISAYFRGARFIAASSFLAGAKCAHVCIMVRVGG